ncbi:alpha/beta hydrolase [Leifsonia naganoensis]|uniref:Alpha-beta hydrolase superfamily lysophospholipase n=1 Tax=Leifsonia naganoensis TaxID=150025 RepID=A0A853DJF8_9MICO|nr:alpha/beta hydrolase [Leifsonia naganoensis]NYK09216.1 alpha-beta hydrolase superfamily lysophospholipase [Leifsonia naganoensis]
MTRVHEWQPDVLGEPFEQLTLPLQPDSEGEVVATLVRYFPAPRLADLRPHRPAADTDVLYVHGWSDYFFQEELARFWHDRGARFFALDLRKYGRSLREGQTPGFVDNLATYDEDIEAALTVMGHGEGSASHRKLILLGHSTGGLTLSLWTNRHPGRAHALVLNSPWLEFQAGGPGRAALAPLIDLHARIDPKAALPNVDLGYYTRSVSKTMDGEWDYDLAWRPVRGFPVHPAWLTAILAGHARVAAGLSLDVPVLTLLSARSALLPYWTPEMMSSDIVLVVQDIAKRALGLAPTVTVSRIDGALHDVFLSREQPRGVAYAEMERWIRGYVSGS